jgi:CII-binding regulator of phage lambda lysogenization HflD
MLTSTCKKADLGAQYAYKRMRITASMLVSERKLARSCNAIERLKSRIVKHSGGRAAA